MLPLLYRDEADIAAWRARWREGLARFEAVDIAPPEVAAQIPELLATVPNFLLHYQGDILREEQQRHGALVTRWVERVWPRRAPTAPSARGRLRVAFASAHLRHHTVCKLFRGWIEGLDRARFEVWALHLGSRLDAVSRQLEAGVDHWIAGLATNEAWVGRDRGRAPGRHRVPRHRHGRPDPAPGRATAGAAAVRGLGTSGHHRAWAPSTASSVRRRWSPPAAEAHYTERLERLPGLGIRYALPEPARGFQRAPRDPARAPLLLCAQSVFKFLPLHYELYARIAARVPAARFAFIPHPVAAVRAQLAAGFRGAFARHGLDFDARATLHPYQDEGAFFARLAEADVLLDTAGLVGRQHHAGGAGHGPAGGDLSRRDHALAPYPRHAGADGPGRDPVGARRGRLRRGGGAPGDRSGAPPRGGRGDRAAQARALRRGGRGAGAGGRAARGDWPEA